LRDLSASLPVAFFRRQRARPKRGSDGWRHLGAEQLDGPHEISVPDAADRQLKERPLMSEDLVLIKDLVYDLAR
jgi:hypothetical protein